MTIDPLQPATPRPKAGEAEQIMPASAASAVSQGALVAPGILCATPKAAPPDFGELNALFEVITPKQTTIDGVDALREKCKADVVFLYDVSPVGLTSQQLFDQLAKYPKVVLCDHHNGAAPLHEAPGQEVTGAQIVVDTLQRLWKAGALSKEDGTPLTLLGVTHSMNIDPDSIACRLLIKSFANPTLRELVWNEPVLTTIIKAARVGDTTLFGGIDIESSSYEALSAAEKLAFIMLQLITDEKHSFVTEVCLDVALLRREAFQLFQKMHLTDNAAKTAARRVFIRDTKTEEGLSAWLAKHGVQSEAFLIEKKSQLSADAAQQALSTDREHRQVLAERHKEIVRLSGRRADIRSAFCGEALQFNQHTITRIFESIEMKVLDAIRTPERYRDRACQFLADLKTLHEAAQKLSTDIDAKITVTTLSERLDFNPYRSQSFQQFPVYDWLREAAAAFGKPWLHLLRRGDGQFVVSARFPKQGEQRPTINLSQPELVAALTALEASCLNDFIKAGTTPSDEPAAKWVIKQNLLRPITPVHIPNKQMIDFLIQHYDQIVTATSNPPVANSPLFPSVTISSGDSAPHSIPFNGWYHFARTQGAVVE
jgi:hypothetical protein